MVQKNFACLWKTLYGFFETDQNIYRSLSSVGKQTKLPLCLQPAIGRFYFIQANHLKMLLILLLITYF